jgi:hypothetical protein
VAIGDEAFDALIGAGVASYGPGRAPGRFSRVELHKDCPSRFRRCVAQAHLELPQGEHYGDLRLSPGGRYEWRFCGEVDGEGSPLPD